MSTNRRKFLTVIGGGAILAASGSAGTFLLTRTPTKALAPWQDAGGYKEPRRRALSYAILAPNPHNRQPWLVDLSQKNKATLFVDTKKMLPYTDPFNRQITIGLGCFLELMRMAAAQDGFRVSINQFPDGFQESALDYRPVAEVTFKKDMKIAKDPLFSAVLDRRSSKEPFDLQKEISDTVLEKIESVVAGNVDVGTTNKSADVAILRSLSQEAMAIELKTPRTYKESVDLMRIGKAEINANPDGLSFGGPLFDSLGALGLFTRQTALDTHSTAYQEAVDAIMTNMKTAMGYVWLITETNTRLDQLNAGRDWLRVNLATTQLGIGVHPLSQALQEYPEMEKHFSAIHKKLAGQGKTVQMFARLGYVNQVPATPRWSIDKKILKV